MLLLRSVCSVCLGRVAPCTHISPKGTGCCVALGSCCVALGRGGGGKSRCYAYVISVPAFDAPRLLHPRLRRAERPPLAPPLPAHPHLLLSRAAWVLSVSVEEELIIPLQGSPPVGGGVRGGYQSQEMVDYGADQRMDVRKREFGRGESEGMPAMKRLKSPKSTPSRGVSFSKDTKVFDGLSPASRLVDSVVWDFFMSQTVNSAEDIVQLFAHITDSCGCLHEVCSLLDDLRWRLDESGCALVLPGGECPCRRRHGPHLPHGACPFSVFCSTAAATRFRSPLLFFRAFSIDPRAINQAAAAARSCKRCTRPPSTSFATLRGRRTTISSAHRRAWTTDQRRRPHRSMTSRASPPSARPRTLRRRTTCRRKTARRARSEADARPRRGQTAHGGASTEIRYTIHQRTSQTR